MRRSLLLLLKVTGVLVLVLLAGPVIAAATGLAKVDGDWRTANRDSSRIAPLPKEAPEAIVQVYGARAFSWRGAFAVHTWIATKAKNADRYRVYQVIGWRYFRGSNPLSRHEDVHPDRRWFGATPEVYRDIRGREAEALIHKIDAAAESYPHQDLYRTWPGPNSNTFVAYMAREIPELGVDLPPTAIGKDYLGGTTFVAPTPSGTGYQLSVFGLASFQVGREEGLEISLLGLAFGVDPEDLAVRLPGLGRIELDRG